MFEPDLEPVSAEEAEALMRRFRWMREDLAAWVRGQSDEALDAEPAERGRPARAILLHILGASGYLSASLGGLSGFSTLHTQAERGTLPIPDALERAAEMLSERVGEATPEQRAAVIERPKDIRTMRKGIRRTLEHDWEHYLELSRRTGGPAT